MMLGSIAGLIYAATEGIIDKVGPPLFFLILLRGFLVGFTIGSSIGLFEAATYYWQRKFPVWKLVVLKSVIFVFIINLWLLSINAISMYFEGNLVHFPEYLATSYLVNFSYSLAAMLVFVTTLQIGKLHRRNELFNYILGKYHKPKLENIVLLFIDLKGSTSLAESIGELSYASFIKYYYDDLSESIFENGGDVYQYVGDEIIIYWKVGSPEKNERAIRCHEMIKYRISLRDSYYLEHFGKAPAFRASIHTGQVAMTWVGEVKREVLFIGDVLNTCSRMQEICKRLGKDFLISGQVLDILPLTEQYHYPFEEKLTPRGKQNEILVFSVEPRMEQKFD